MNWRVAVAARLGALELQVELEGDQTPVALVGPNAAGKTSLLRMIAGALQPQAGQIRIGDRTLFDADRNVDLPPEARAVGYVPQGFQLFAHLSVIDNVAFGLSTGAGRRPRAERRRAALETLDALGCAHLAGRTPANLSGGEQQRVALARALIVGPRMLLLDEPLSALDSAARRAVRAQLAERLAQRALPAVVVTHDQRDVAALGATVCVLEQGRIVQCGSPAELRAAPATDFVAEFFDTPTEPAA